MTSLRRRENCCRIDGSFRIPGCVRLRQAAIGAGVALCLFAAGGSDVRGQYQYPDTATTDAARLSAAFRQAMQLVEPAVVTITISYAGDPAGMVPTGVVGTDDRPRVGAGVIITEQGHVVTSARLLQNVTAARVRTSDGRFYDAHSLKMDGPSDLAIIRIDPTTRLPFAKFGNSQTLQRGDWVLAVGGGTGDVASFSTGVIGTNAARSPDLGGVSSIQHDAETDWSRAGGPLVNLAGEVVGFNLAPTMTPRGSAASFAYPVTESRTILRSLIQGAGTGVGGGGVPATAGRAYLGMAVTDLLSSDVQRLSAAGVQGALVTSVVPGGPAAALGLAADDILISFEGRSVFNARDLQTLLEQRRPGDKVLLTIWRTGKRYEGQTTLIDQANRP